MVNPDLNNNDENPYDFIFKQDKSAVPAGGPGPNKFGTSNRQMIIFGGFVVAVLVIIAIIFTIITSANKDDGLEAISVRAYQAEISRVLDVGNKNVTDTQLMKKLVTLEVSLLTDQTKLNGVLATKGVKPSDVQLAQHRRTARDTEITNSLQVDRHDQVFEDVIDKLVQDYYRAIRTAQSAARTNSELSTLTSLQDTIDIIYNLNQEENSPEAPQSDSTSQPSEAVEAQTN